MGTTDMPRTHPQRTLANWVWIQRLRRKGTLPESEQLTSAQVALLDKLGFTWDPTGRTGLSISASSKPTAKSTLGGYDPIEDDDLSRWAFAAQGLSPGPASPGADRSAERNRIHLGIEGSWKTIVAEYYEELKAPQAQHGDANPLRRRFERLGPGCVHQRQRRKKGEMPQAQIELLDQLGFTWLKHVKTPGRLTWQPCRLSLPRTVTGTCLNLYDPIRSWVISSRANRAPLRQRSPSGGKGRPGSKPSVSIGSHRDATPSGRSASGNLPLTRTVWPLQRDHQLVG
ncbi:hypothetical protein EMGBS10_01570 [Opitutia bacterium]|nr:hypothetical protein EMGBS10_01570 [Opitutae bacterium]